MEGGVSKWDSLGPFYSVQFVPFASFLKYIIFCALSALYPIYSDPNLYIRNGFCATMPSMKIVLTATDSRGKNIAFATDSLATYSLKEAVSLVKQEKIDGVHVVNRRKGKYIRSNPNTVSWDNLDHLSLTIYSIMKAVDDLRYVSENPGFRRYWKYYSDNLRDIAQKKEDLIYIDGQPRAPKKHVTQKVASVRKHIFDAAKRFDLDPCTIGAILIDEVTRFLPFEAITDAAALIGKNTSVGIAQVTIKTARGLIKQGYYNPNPKKFLKENIDQISSALLYTYLIQPRHSVFFGAAKMRSDIDSWFKKHGEDISASPEKIGYLYSRGAVDTIRMNSRAKQIGGEFYKLSKKILNGK